MTNTNNNRYFQYDKQKESIVVLGFGGTKHDGSVMLLPSRGVLTGVVVI